jgi:hypothetical protein
MFTIPEVLVNFEMKNLLKKFEAEGNFGAGWETKVFWWVLIGLLIFFLSFQCIWIVCMAYGSFGNDIDYLSSWIIGIYLCWHYRANYVANDNDRYFLVLIL